MSKEKTSKKDMMREAFIKVKNERYPDEEPSIETIDQLWNIIISDSRRGIVTREEINKITMKHKIAKDFVKALEEEIEGQKKITTDDN